MIGQAALLMLGAAAALACAGSVRPSAPARAALVFAALGAGLEVSLGAGLGAAWTAALWGAAHG